MLRVLGRLACKLVSRPLKKVSRWGARGFGLVVVCSLALLISVNALGGGRPLLDASGAIYARVLRRFVHAGLVDYRGLHASPGDLNEFLRRVAAIHRDVFDTWPRVEREALLINLYNAQTLALIVDHYPVGSIKDIGSLLSGPWSQPVVHLFGRTLTLDDLEHEWLRKRYGDPRVHFALVCASRGCPPLRAEPYAGERLDAQLDDQARVFLADPTKNRVDDSRHVLHLSPIFKWYREDFVSAAGSVVAFVKAYLPPGESASLDGANLEIRYTDYDWSLNDWTGP
jgi:Protein of unknown function, DUF547